MQYNIHGPSAPLSDATSSTYIESSIKASPSTNTQPIIDATSSTNTEATINVLTNTDIKRTTDVTSGTSDESTTTDGTPNITGAF